MFTPNVPPSRVIPAHDTLVLWAVDPTAIFGDLLPPVESVAAAISLFQGGLSLRASEVEGSQREFSPGAWTQNAAMSRRRWLTPLRSPATPDADAFTFGLEGLRDADAAS